MAAARRDQRQHGGCAGGLSQLDAVPPRDAPYTGKVRITATSGGSVTGSPSEVAVSLKVRGVAMLVSPKDLSFEVKYGENPRCSP